MSTRPPPTLGRYRLGDEAPLGRSVHPATDPETGRAVLVKVLHRPSASEERIDRFAEEVRLHASVAHPGLVALLDAGTDGDWSYLVLERLAGRTLADDLAASGRLPVGRALRVLIGMLGALAELHDRRIVHRDVKPANVLLVPDRLEPDGRPVLLDLGIAKDRSERGRTITRDGSGSLGSEHYAAPEVVADSRRATFAADVYSAGVVLHEMLVGRLPIGEDRARIDEVVPDAPPWLHTLFARMTASDERDRPPDAGAVLESLRIELSPAVWFALARPDASPHPPPGRLPPPPVEAPPRPGLATRLLRRVAGSGS